VFYSRDGDMTDEEDPFKNKALEDYDDQEDMWMEEVFFDDLPSAQDVKWNDICFDRQRYDGFKPFCLYEFLVVEWNGEVAYRIGIGNAY
jgi:hypothetical protein